MISLGALSYGAASATFAFLAVLLLTSWQGRAQGGRLIVAVVMSSVWAAGLAWQAAGGPIPLIAAYTLEFLRDGAWIAVLAGLAQGMLPRFLSVASHTLWVGLLVAGWSAFLLEARGVSARGAGGLLIAGGLVVAVMVLVLLEQVYRNAGPRGRNALGFLVLGIGGAYVYDLFMFSQAQLLQGISPETWQARGLVCALLAPAIAVAARRNPEWSLDVFVSRHVVFYTTMTVAAGVYLVVMAVGGYYVREVGGTWGAFAQVLFLAGAVILLGMMVLSGGMRRRLQVFISKHFYRNKYDYRVEWLRFIETLSRSDEDDPRRRGLQAVAQIFDAPGGILMELDDTNRRAVAVAAWPMSLQDLSGRPRLDENCQLLEFIRETGWVVDLTEYRDAPDVYQNIVLPDWLAGSNAFRIVSPLMDRDRLLGVIALYAPPAPFHLTFEDRDLLKTVCRHVATHIAQHAADQRLAESRQFEAYNRLTAFLMHDLKNAIAQLQLVVRNAERHRRNPDFVDDAIGTIGNAVGRLSQLVDQLRAGANRPVSSEVDVGQLVEQASARCSVRRPVPQLRCELEPGTRVLADAERLSAVIEHVIRNAQDATAPDDSLSVVLRAIGRDVVIDVVDTGAGMSPEFLRERLFRPFDSTKGARGMGIGAYQAREYVRALGGEVEVESSPGRGTRFSIKLPRVEGLPAGPGSTEGQAIG